MKVLSPGQCLRHATFGIGVATSSNEQRTTIDFHDHGVKVFVTRMLEAELMSEAPPRPAKPRASRTKKAAGAGKSGSAS